MALYCSNNCIIIEWYACNVAQRSYESSPIINGEQPETTEDSEVALNDPRCIARAHPTAALSDCDPGLLTNAVYLASAHT